MDKAEQSRLWEIRFASQYDYGNNSREFKRFDEPCGVDLVKAWADAQVRCSIAYTGVESIRPVNGLVVKEHG